MMIACWGSKRPCSASRSAGSLSAQFPEREVGEHVGVGGAVDQRGEHRPAGFAEQVGGDAVELDAGVLEQLVQSSGFALAVADLGFAVAGEVPQRADRLGWDQARAQQPGFGQAAQPLRVGHVGLAAGDLLDVAGVDEDAFEPVLQDRPDRLPVDAGRFHRDLGDTVRLKPVGQRQQARDGRRGTSATSSSRSPASAGTRTHAVTLAL